MSHGSQGVSLGWHRTLAASLMWAGPASFLFHASLTERWRVLDAGATMGVIMPVMGYSAYRVRE